MRAPTFRELIDAVASLSPDMTKADGDVNLAAVARYCANMGHPVSQPTLYRHYHKSAHSESKLDDETVNALNHALGIPKVLLRGEPMDADTKEALTRFPLSTYLLAQKIQTLSPTVRESLLQHIDKLLQDETNRKLRALGDKNIK